MSCRNCGYDAEIVEKRVTREKEIALRDTLHDLSMYASHLKQQYYIGSRSPFHMLVGRIEARLGKKTCSPKAKITESKK